jgi:tRNA (adenine37-N6)-methyltransferase
MTFNIIPIAFAKNIRKKIFDDVLGDVVTEIRLAEKIPTRSLDGIEEFSHLELVFYFHRAAPKKVVFSGHPRENVSYPKVGIFAQRKKDRVNSLGLTVVRLIEHRGRILKVKNFDGIDGTPILDIKPVMKGFLPREKIREPKWAKELMAEYWTTKT